MQSLSVRCVEVMFVLVWCQCADFGDDMSVVLGKLYLKVLGEVWDAGGPG